MAIKFSVMKVSGIPTLWVIAEAVTDNPTQFSSRFDLRQKLFNFLSRYPAKGLHCIPSSKTAIGPGLAFKIGTITRNHAPFAQGAECLGSLRPTQPRLVLLSGHFYHHVHKRGRELFITVGDK